MKKLEFIKDTHSYYYGNIKVPSVTEIIGSVFPFPSYIPKEARDYAMDRGTKIHKTVQLYNEGKLDFKSLDETTKTVLETWVKECSVLGIEPKNSKNEVSLYSKKYKYCGTLDCVERMIIELKTGQIQLQHRLQTAAYLQLWNENFPKQRVTRRLCFYFDRATHAIFHTKPYDFKVFLSCLELYKFMKEVK